MSSHVAAASRRSPPRHRLGGYREYAPPPALAPAVEAVWVHSTPAELPGHVGRFHRVLPDPALGLAFECRRAADGRPEDGRLLVVGPKTAPQLFDLRPGVALAAIKLKLEWAEPLLSVRPAEHHDTNVELPELRPRLARRLLDILSATRTPEEALDELAAVVAARLRSGARPRSPLAARALDLVRASAGRTTVDAVARATGASPRHLRRSVGEGAGVSLKAYARTLRFVRAILDADRQPVPAWSRIAADAGFCDQSHLVRESRALSGLSPVQVDRERRAEAETSNPW